MTFCKLKKANHVDSRKITEGFCIYALVDRDRLGECHDYILHYDSFYLRRNPSPKAKEKSILFSLFLEQTEPGGRTSPASRSADRDAEASGRGVCSNGGVIGSGLERRKLSFGREKEHIGTERSL